MAKASDNKFPYLHLVPATAPSSPAAGAERLFLDSGDGNKLKRKNSSGTVTTVEGGGGGSGLSASYLGKNAVGASWRTIDTNGVFKKVTTGGASELLSVGAHLRQGGDNPSGCGAALFSDSSGTPSRLLAFSTTGADTILLDASSGEVATSGIGRWFTMPLAYELAAATDYWIGIWSTDMASIDIAYDTGGSDRTYTGATWLADWGRYTVATTTRDHSIRARILS